MPDIVTSVPSGYISDAELLGWLEQKSNEQNDKLRESMGLSEERSRLMGDLSQLKADLDGGAPSDEILTEMTALRDEYAGTPYAEELDALLGAMQERIDAGGKTPSEIEDEIAVQDEIIKNPDSSDREVKKAQTERDRLYAQRDARDVPFRDMFSGKLEAQIDELGRIDQLELIQIQELVSDARQTSQLGSNILASRDQASNSIVGNIRG